MLKEGKPIPKSTRNTRMLECINRELKFLKFVEESKLEKNHQVVSKMIKDAITKAIKDEQKRRRRLVSNTAAKQGRRQAIEWRKKK
jgi:hypothetical protein